MSRRDPRLAYWRFEGMQTLLSRTTRHRPLAPLIALGILVAYAPSALQAREFVCENSSGVAIDRHSLLTSETRDGSEPADKAEAKAKSGESVVSKPQRWIVDPQRGWRRSDVSFFAGACSEDKGYLVCKDTNATYGEATFSLHPDKHNFLLVYMDYGLNALAFVGSCRTR